jgi:ABC-type multidrug transport system fused ATPase/permease subunit
LIDFDKRHFHVENKGCRANYNIRVKLHRSLLLQEAAFFDTSETGYLLSRLNSDVNKIGQVISYHINVVLRQFAQFVFGSIYLLRISPRLSMYAFAGILLVAYLSAVYGDFARDLAEKVQDTFANATAVAETSFTMSETIRAFDGVDIESDKFEASQYTALELEEVQAWAYGTHKFLSDTLQDFLQVALLVACWTVGKAGGLPAKDLTTFMFYTGFVLESSNEVGDQWAKIQQAIGASRSVFDLIKRVPAIHDPPSSSTTSSTNNVASDHETFEATTPKPVIAMKNVTIEYDAMERPALSGINTNIYSGDRVALVGKSGSGKSSMLRTMLRFYDPSTGMVELDGEDLRNLTRSETASHVSLVEQEPHVFPMSLMENVLYGIDKDDIDPDTGSATYNLRWRTLVSDCLKLAGLNVAPGNELGLELDTRIGEGGRSLSGGQRQRVAIARAIIRSPQVLLLDEPTAALDSESEKMVVQSLQMAMQQTKSMVMVTHRLSVVRSLDVNRVVVLDKGKIVEEGHPEDLLQDEDSLYAGLAREQGITKLDDLTHRISHASC